MPREENLIGESGTSEPGRTLSVGRRSAGSGTCEVCERSVQELFPVRCRDGTRPEARAVICRECANALQNQPPDLRVRSVLIGRLC